MDGHVAFFLKPRMFCLHAHWSVSAPSESPGKNLWSFRFSPYWISYHVVAQVLHHPSFAFLFSYPFVMALIDVVDSLQQLRNVFEDAPKATLGSTEWMPVQLTGLSLRDNASSTTAKHHWACVQLSSLVITESWKSIVMHQVSII